MIIYKITNIINNKSYIGITINRLEDRIKAHIRKGYALHNSIKKYGIENFKISIIEEIFDKDILLEKEKFYINKYNTLIPFGYNITPGGQFGDTLTNNPRRSEIIRKFIENHADINGDKNPMYGKKHKKESKDKIREKSLKRSNVFPIIQKDLSNNIIKIWDSASQIQRETGFFKTNIISCCKKKYGYKTYKNFRWEYGI